MVTIFNYDKDFPPLSDKSHPPPKDWSEPFIQKKHRLDVTLSTSLSYILIKDKQLKEEKFYIIHAFLVAIEMYSLYFKNILSNRSSLKKMIDAIDNGEIVNYTVDEYKQLKKIYAYWLYEAELVNIN